MISRNPYDAHALFRLLLAGWLGTALAAGVCEAAPSSVDMGRYVALAADCSSCHTAPGGAPFAGGNPLKSNLGTLFGPNITSDIETGIGSWTKADFERALRRGIRKDGAYLYPAMPYDSYTKITPADMDALWSYIHALPAVKNTVPKNTLPFPLTIRGGLAVWQSLYFKPGPFQPAADHDATWNRGAYLVEALGHCADCHTPRNLAQGLEAQHGLTGASIEGWYAPDISSDPESKLRAWKTRDLAHYLKTGLAPNNAKAFGPMQEVIDDSLRHLSDPDLLAMAVYLRAQGNSVQPKTPSAPKLPEERLAAGKTIYEDNCRSCHQSNGKGIPGSAPALAGNDAVTAAEPFNVIMAILEGFPTQGTWGAMGSFAANLSDDQISDVTNYVRTAWGNGAAPNATPWSVENWRKNAQTPMDQSNALLCPSLPQSVMQPAYAAGSAALKQAGADRGKMQQLVSTYFSARPAASAAQVVEALSTAYCRVLADDHLTQARMSAQIAAFAQNAAVAIGRKPATDPR
jgi:mono/diheme cytochrome c family protein